MSIKKRLPLRILSACLVVSLIHANAAWALDPRVKLKKDKRDLETMSESRPMMPPELSTAFEQRAKASVRQNQEIQSLMQSQSQGQGQAALNQGNESDPSRSDPGYDLTSSNTQLIDLLHQSLDPKKEKPSSPSQAEEIPAKPAAGPVLELRSEIPTLTNARILKVEYKADGKDRSRVFRLEEGENALEIAEAGENGLVTNLFFKTILDTRPPAVALTSEPPLITAQSQVTIDYTADGQAKSRSFDLIEGLNTLKLTEMDAAGNQTLMIRNVTLDTAAPEVVLSSVPALTNQSRITVAYTSDGIARSRSFELVDGVNELFIDEADAAGNATRRSVSVTLDAQAPEIRLRTDVPMLTNRPDLKILYEAEGAQKEKAFVLNEGANILTITETDPAGNPSTITRTVILDTIAPAVVLGMEPPVLTRQPRLTVGYTVDGQTRSREYDLIEGVNTIEIRERDEAGNQTVLTRTLNLDSVAPAVSLTAEPPALTSQRELTVQYVSDGRPKARQFALAEGLNTLTITEVDAAGNRTTLSRTVTLDTIAPVLVLAAEPPVLTNQPEITIQYSSDGQGKSKTFALAEGLNTLTITQVDAAGNQTTLTRTLTLDSVAPALSLSAEPPTLTNQPEVTVLYTSDGQSKAKTFQLNEGLNTLTITEVDVAGNRTTLSRTVTLDTIAPMITLTGEVPALTNRSELTIAYQVDGVAVAKLFDLREGVNELVISETDPAGNVSRRTLSVLLDTQAPRISFLTDIPELTNQRDLRVVYTADGIQKEKIFTLQEGANTIAISEADTAGNLSTVTRTLVLDTLAPVLVLAAEPPVLTNRPEITIQYTSDGQGKSRTFALAEGLNTLTITQVDAAGNQATLIRTLTLDTVAPALTLSAEPPVLTNRPELTVQYVSDGHSKARHFALVEGLNTVTITETDAAGNVTTLTRTLTLDTIPPALVLSAEPPALTNRTELEIPYTSDGQLRSKRFALSEGLNTLTIIETDAAGNRTTLTRTLTLDTIAPALVVSAEPPVLTNQPEITVHYTADGQVKTKVFNLTEGLNTLTITETDAAGNAITLTRTSTLDTIAPTVTLSAEPPALTNKPELTFHYTSDGQAKSKVLNLTEGSNTLTIIEADAAGNVTTLMRTLTLDTISPALVLATEPPVLTNQPEITIQYTSDGHDKSKTFALSEGLNTLTINETDAAGNATALTRTLTLDTIAPALILAGEPPVLTNKAEVTVHYTSDGQAKTKVFNLTEGLNTLTINETDAAGNTTTLTRTLTLDTIAPQVILTAPLAALTKDNRCTIEYVSDGQAKSMGFDLIEGLNTLTITESDAAGNTSVYTFEVTRKLPPTIELTVPIPPTTAESSITVRYRSDGADKERVFALKPGENIITLSETDVLNQTTSRSFWITSTAPAGPADPDPAQAASAVTLTTATGDQIQYDQTNRIQAIRTGQNDLLNNIALDAAGAIRDAQILLADGSVQLFENGQVIGYQRPDKTRIFYKDGRVFQVQAPDGALTLFTYADDQILADSPQTLAVYTLDGILRSVRSKTTGALHLFEQGILVSVTRQDGSTVRYSRSTDPDGRTHLTADRPAADLPFREAWLHPDGQAYARILMPDGGALEFDPTGTLRSSTDAQGKTVTFDLVTSPLGNLLQAGIDLGGVRSSYDAQGRLRSVDVNGLTVHYRQDSQEIDHLAQADGTRIDHLRLDAAGNIVDATVTTAAGDVRTYIDGHLIKVVQADASELDFIFDAVQARSVLNSILTTDKLRYTLDYQPDQIVATLDASFIPRQDTVVRMQYDGTFGLKEAVRQNSEIIRYASGNRIAEILTPSEAPKVFDHEPDGTYSVTQGHNRSFYDAAGNLLRVEIEAHDGVPQPIEVVYRYGRIREVYKLAPAAGQPASQPGDQPAARTLVFKYSYTAAPDGSERVLIEDVEEKSLKTYSDGLLLTSLQTETNVLSTFSYAEAATGKVQRVDLTRLGRSLHTYHYAYEAGDTLVTDEKGIVRRYDAAGKLALMDRDGGERYRYSYAAGAGDEEIVTEELVRKQLSDGSVAHYASGALLRVELEDGGVVTEVQLDGLRNIARAVLTQPDGVQKVFSHSALLEEIRPDGTHFFFNDGRLARAVDASGAALEYSYDEDPAGAVTAVHVRQSSLRLDYAPDGGITGIKLSGVPDPAEVMDAVARSYSGGVNGPYADDGLFNTAQTAGFGGGSGNQYVELYAENRFLVPSTLTQVTYRMTAGASSSGGKKANNGSSANSRIEVLDAATGQWKSISGTELGQSHSNGGGGGSTAYANTADPAVVNVQLSNILGVRAYARAAAYSNGGGSFGGSAAIYELQYTLADQSQLVYAETADGLGRTTGYTLTGPLGSLVFDAQGRVQSGASIPAYAAAATVLDGKLAGLLQTPHLAMVRPELPAGFSDWTGAATAASLTADAVMVQEYSSSGVLETQTKADGTVTLFDGQNRPAQVVDAGGALLIEYFYDAEGHPSRVYLKNARDVLPVEVARARQSIEEQRARSLLELARQKNLAYQSIYAQADTQRHVLADQLRLIEVQRDAVALGPAKGRAARNQKADLLKEIDGIISDYLSAITDVAVQEADAYAALDAQVQKVSDDIRRDADRAFVEVAVQEDRMKQAILKQEASPVIYDHYRRILGRDPSTAEYDEWVAQVRYDATVPSDPHRTLDGRILADALTEFLAASPELAERSAYVQTVKARVQNELTGYLALSEEARLSFAASLGIGSSELIQLSDSDAAQIAQYISTRSLHFGQSAFLSLESLLDQKGIAYARDDLAVRCILIDVLTGVITPLDDGDLVISAYALNTTASLYGVALKAAHLSWEDLQSVYQSNPTARVIGHISGNHYVVITGITDTTITYIDPGIGKDKHNESLTVAKEGFLKAWQGHVVTETSILTPVIASGEAANQSPGKAPRFLSASEAQGIRGAFWGSFLGIMSWVFAFLPPVSFALRIASIAVSVIEGDWISAITSTLSLSFPGGDTIGSALQEAFSNAFQGVSQALGAVGGVLTRIGTGLQHVYQTVSGFVDTAVGFLPGIGSALKDAALKAGGLTLGTQVVNAALNIGLNLGVTKGLTALGVSPQISSILGSLASASLAGALKGDTVRIMSGSEVLTTQAQHIRSSVLQTLTLNQVGQLGLELGLDTRFTHIVGQSLAVIQGQQIELGGAFDFSEAFQKILPDLTGSLGMLGFNKLGDSIGFDPHILSAFAMPIIGGISRSFDAGAILGQDLIRSVRDGLTGGILQAGLTFAIEQMDIDNPLLSSLASAALTQTIASVLDPSGNIIEDLISKAGVYAHKYAGDLSSTGFLQYAQTHGISKAIEDHATSMFTRGALEEIHKAGGIAQIISGRAQLIDYNGVTLTRVSITDKEGFVLDRNGNFVGTFSEINGVKEEVFGQFDASSGEIRLIEGSIRQTHPNGEVSYIEVRDGKTYRLVLKQRPVSPSATVKEVPCTDTGSTCVRFDLSEGGMEPVWDWEVVENYEGRINIRGANVIDGLYFINGEVTINIVGGYGESLNTEIDSVSLTDTINARSTKFLFGNGFENLVRPENTRDELMGDYITNLQIDDELITESEEVVVDLYEMTGMYLNGIDWFLDFYPEAVLKISPVLAMMDWMIAELIKNDSPESSVKIGIFEKMRDRLKSSAEGTGIGNNLTLEVIKQMEALQKTKGKLKDAIAFSHSGFTAPVLTAIQAMQYDVDTVLVFEGPHPNYYEVFSNPSLRRIIHVMGSGWGPIESVAEGDSLVPFLGWAKFTNPAHPQFENINIEITGAFHSDYSYDPDQYEPGGEFENASAERQEMNRKVNLFMRKLYQAALTDQTTPDDLKNFFDVLQEKGFARFENDIWKIDLKNYNG